MKAVLRTATGNTIEIFNCAGVGQGKHGQVIVTEAVSETQIKMHNFDPEEIAEVLLIPGQVVGTVPRKMGMRLEKVIG